MEIKANEWQAPMPPHSYIYGVTWSTLVEPSLLILLTQIEVPTLIAFRTRDRERGASNLVSLPQYVAIGEGSIYLYPTSYIGGILRIRYAPPLLEI